MRCYCSQIHIQLIIISVFESNNPPREKNVVIYCNKFSRDIFEEKSRRGSLYYFEDNKMGLNISFALFFNIYSFINREIHGNCSL